MASSGGVILHYYEPETTKELIELVCELNTRQEYFDIVGYTSNIYFKDTYNVDNLITTRRLNSFQDNKNEVTCECGVSVSKLSKEMVSQGVVGFAGLIDLPGTIGAAVYGNAGCYDCLLSDVLISVKVLESNGVTKEYKTEELHYSKRNSDFKRGAIKGAILSVKLKKNYGDIKMIERMAAENHTNRIKTQPGPQNNLGTTYCYFGKRTKLGVIVKYASGLLCKVASALTLNVRSWKMELTLIGYKKLIPYLWNIDRFIWKDSQADKYFVEYQKVINKLFQNPQLEIEVKE